MRRFPVLLAFSVACIAHAQQIQVSPANRTIAVTATEQAERRADTAVVHVGYQLYAATSQGVAEHAAQTSKAITDALRKAGVPDEAVESEGQSTGPVQDFQPQNLSPAEQAQRKFQAEQSWTVRVGVDACSKVLAAAVAAGANQSGAIDWSIADETALNAEAAGKALKHARTIAEQMAGGLSSKLGPLVYASNEARQAGLPINGRLYQQVQERNGPPAAPAAVKLSLSAPMVRRSATVYAVFSLQ